MVKKRNASRWEGETVFKDIKSGDQYFYKEKGKGKKFKFIW